MGFPTLGWLDLFLLFSLSNIHPDYTAILDTPTNFATFIVTPNCLLDVLTIDTISSIGLFPDYCSEWLISGLVFGTSSEALFINLSYLDTKFQLLKFTSLWCISVSVYHTSSPIIWLQVSDHPWKRGFPTL